MEETKNISSIALSQKMGSQNNRWTIQSHNVIEEEKVPESVSNSRASIHTKEERIHPLSVDNKNTFDKYFAKTT
jgi:hypothetical protein